MCRALGGLLSTLALKMDEIEHDLVREQLIFLFFIFIFCVILFGNVSCFFFFFFSSLLNGLYFYFFFFWTLTSDVFLLLLLLLVASALPRTKHSLEGVPMVSCCVTLF